MLSNKVIRKRLINYMNSYFSAKKIKGMPNNLAFKRAFKPKTPGEVLEDIEFYAKFAEDENPKMREDLKKKTAYLKKVSENFKLEKFEGVLKELKEYSNADEKEIIQNLIILYKKFLESENDSEKEEILNKIDLYKSSILNDDKIEITYRLETIFLNILVIYAVHVNFNAYLCNLYCEAEMPTSTLSGCRYFCFLGAAACACP